MKKILSVFLILFLAACGGTKKPPEHAKPPADAHQTPVGPAGEEESAERMASNAIVDDGTQAFRYGRYDAAADLFQQAVTVDPTNGAAYYHLALAKMRSGEYGDAEGLIEKADQLLGANPDWVLKLEELKREFHQKNPDEPSKARK
ncbi:MAG TPA: tetratricopeptide repeat protein [bacterium]|nr:tetratricopeptide repeat protein [bacterium]